MAVPSSSSGIDAEAQQVIRGLLFLDKYPVGRLVRTDEPALARGVEIIRDVCDGYFQKNSRPDGTWWYGKIEAVDVSREDCILVAHHLGNNPEKEDRAFVAWYKPGDVTEGW